MGSPAAWYQSFYANLVVPPKFVLNERIGDFSPTCYALTISLIDFKELPIGSTYELNLFFYDTISKQFFGRQWTSSTQKAEKTNRIKYNETLFFYNTINDERVVLVCELVQKEEEESWVVGWTTIPIFRKNQPITDFSTRLVTQFPWKRYQLYKGTCMCLKYVNGSHESNSEIVKQDAVLTCVLQTHEKMISVVRYLPEFYIVGKHDLIPGLQISNGSLQLAIPEVAPRLTAVFDNLQVSFTTNVNQIDAAILNALNSEACWKLNRPSNDPNISKMTILERKIRICVHNGLCYVDEPTYLPLSGTESIGATRRRSQSLSRASKLSSYDSDVFQTRNCARLNLFADEKVAVIFALDYMIGTQNSDGRITNLRTVMICWNAWCPYHDNSFTLADTVHIPLVGGPRPNPDDVLCFKNMLSLRDTNSNPFARTDPQIHLKFNFAIVDSTDKQLLLQIPAISRAEDDPTPQPKPDITAHVEQLVETIAEPNKSPELLAVSQKSKQRPLHKSTSVPALSPNNSNSELIGVIDSAPTRIIGFSRSLISFFGQLNFAPILNRSGKSPSIIDPTSTRPINIELDINSRLDTHEVVIQFLAISTVRNNYISNLQRSTRYFFTLRFYRFDEVTTEMLLAQAARESRIGDPIIFQRIDENEQILRTNSNGFMARFTVERMHANDNADFVNYLLTGNLCIEVWDADSLMHVGSSIIPLKGLLRQGADSIQSNLQCPIVESGFPIERTTTGLLFLRIANIGHPSNNQMDLFESRNKSAVITNRLVRLGRTNQIHQLRAQPLGAIHESALQRFLNTQKLDIRQRKEEIFGYDGLRRMKKWEEMKEKQTERLPKSTLKRFIFEEELEAYRTLRMEGKSAKLLKAVFRSITTHHIIYAKSGQVEFFEYVLRNTFAEPINCLIDVNNPCISVVTNTDEWKAFKDANKLKTSVERDLFHVESNGMKSVYLNALESLNIPFKFDLFARGPPLESTTEAYEIKIIFKRAETGEPIAILEVLIQSRGHTWDTSFRWFHEENARCSKLLKIQGIKGNQKVTAIRCTDPHVLCSIRNAPNGGQELLITCYAPESPLCREFLVLMYADRYFGTQLTSRGFALHGMQRLNVEAVQGQTTKIPLFLKPPNDPEMLIAFKSSTDCATVIPTEPIALTSSQPLNDLKLLILPTFSGKRTFLITAIEMKLRKLLNAWIVFVNVKEPTIAKTYEIEITNSTADIAKKIQFTNEYPVERNYRFYTSNEQIVSVENEYETVSANEQASIHLRFHPIEIDHPVYLDVLVFCEDAVNGQQEEAYGLRIKYTP